MENNEFTDDEKYRLDKLLECTKYLATLITATAAVILTMYKVGVYDNSEPVSLFGGAALLISAVIGSLILYAATVSFVMKNKNNWLFAGYKNFFYGVICFYIGALISFIPL